MFAAGRIKRVMECRYFPKRLRVFERVAEPTLLSKAKGRRVEHEKVYETIASAEQVVAGSAHVKQRVVDLILAACFDVVVPERRVKTHPLFQQCRKRFLEVFTEQPSSAVGINVVANSEREVQRRGLVSLEHQIGHCEFVGATRSEVADYRKPRFACRS